MDSTVTPFIIAEFASTHDADLGKALELIRIAKDCGADAVKTAWGSSGDRIAQRMHAPDLAPIYWKYFCWPRAWIAEMSKAAHDLGLEFLCTVDCFEDIDVVAPHVDRFKIASWGASDHAFIEAHAKYDKPIVLSTGATRRNRIAFDAIPDDNDYFILHCVSAYPAPLEECNLSVLSHDERLFCGFSDHTANTITGGLAVAAGAHVLEVHYCHPNTSKDNPDRVVSLKPWELKTYITFARQAAVAMGDGVKRIMPSEQANTRHRYV